MIMNWLRDNILKILIILGITIVVIIIFALFMKPKEDNVVKGSKYSELETKLQNAAIKYVNSHIEKIRANRDSRVRWAETHVGGRVVAKYLIDCLVSTS